MTARAFVGPLPWIALAAGLLACAGAGGAGRPAAAAAAPAAETAGARPEPASSARAERLFAEAVRAMEDHEKAGVPPDWALLERKWRAAAEAGDAAEAHFNLGVALERQGRDEEARGAYARALERKPSLRQAAVNLAVLEERRGDPATAQAAYARVLREFPEDALARERLAAIYLEAGQVDDAARLAREALLRDPRSAPAHLTMLRVAIARKDWDLAKLVALRAEKQAPTDPRVPWLAGEVLTREGDRVAAEARYRRALALDPGFTPARRALLRAAVDAGRWTAVEEEALAVLKDDPSDARVQLVLGIARRHLGKPDAALAAYDAAEKLAGGALPEVFLARGVLLARVKVECEPALAALAAYERAAGPVLPAGSPVPMLRRECAEVLEQNRQAQEAAEAMRREAERKAAGGAPMAGDAPPAAPPVAPAPTSSGVPSQ
jgi:tetratricopeptide (TPR) repeat protein